MEKVFQQGRVFIYIVTAFGLLAMAVNIFQLVHKEKDFVALIVGITAATFFFALCGYADRMYAVPADMAEPAQFTRVAFVAERTAASVLGWGAALCALNAVVGAVGCHIHRNQGLLPTGLPEGADSQSEEPNRKS